MKEILIIIPAYNEERTIKLVLDDLHKVGMMDVADVLVVNDASKDNTNYIVKKEKVKLVTHVFNLGYGSAIQLGYKYAVRRGYKYVIQMDADGQHDVSNVQKLVKELQTPDADGRYPDIVIGSRFLPGSGDYQVGCMKRFAIKVFRHYIKRHTGQVITDPTSGLQAFRFPAFLYYSKYANFDERYPDANMILQMILLKYQVREIPAQMHQRDFGTSMHHGLKPVFYMYWMALSLVGIVIRFKWLKIDEGIGECDVVWKKEREEDKRKI